MSTTTIWRTNEFEIKNRPEFDAVMKAYGGAVVVMPADATATRVVLFSGTHDEGFPSQMWSDSAHDFLDVPLTDAVSQHLAAGEVAIFVLSEIDGPNIRPRHIGGGAVAVNERGQTCRVSTSDICAAVASLSGSYSGVRAPWGDGLPVRAPADTITWTRTPTGSVRVTFVAKSSMAMRLLTDRLYATSASFAFEPLPDAMWEIDFKNEGDLREVVLRTLGAPADLPQGQPFHVPRRRRAAAVAGSVQV